MNKPLLTLFAVRNKDGKYFRSKGFQNEFAKIWVDSLEKARIYPKAATARAQITFFAKNYPNFGIPELVALDVMSVRFVKETERVNKSIARIKREEKIRQQR